MLSELNFYDFALEENCPIAWIQSAQMLQRKLVTFDAFNTLFYITPSPPEIYAQLAARRGFKVSPESLKIAFSKAYKAQTRKLPNFGATHCLPAKDWWKYVVRNSFPAKLAMEPAFDPIFEDIYHHFSLPNSFRLFPETLQVLEEIRKKENVVLGVISNSDARTVRVLSGLGLGQYFDLIL